jgi:hypothetical protein
VIPLPGTESERSVMVNEKPVRNEEATNSLQILFSLSIQTLTYPASHRISRAIYRHKFPVFCIEENTPFLPKPIKLSSSKTYIALLVAFIRKQSGNEPDRVQ